VDLRKQRVSNREGKNEDRRREIGELKLQGREG
jgi:hypothetical protein